MHIRSIVLNHDDTNDILQETFIKVYQNIGKFKGKSQLFSWIYRIATNQTLDFIKQKNKNQKISSEEINQRIINSIISDPLFDGDKAEILLQKAILHLPEKQQLVFKMRYYQELEYTAISEILGTSTGALKASYHHAVKKIEDFLKSH
ncbi:RNA polymerase sigma-70 factor (ECF subfamily) [Myroides indicus]|uniref:RNA polymerase sigma-70 factor (ECF subfamily) n=2 Tax=Myroides indicus TaxID=1323422 RepID=A0A4R7F1Y8_9FLAO|nr:RNA polymerase sigma-70 factor (ECF subfamily) [Myroides indicus]